MATFIRTGKQGNIIWNKETDKPIRFIDDKYSTNNEIEIKILRKNKYKENKETKEIKETKETKEETKEKPEIKKPGRPKKI